MFEKLLSASDDREIRDAIRLVTETFMVTPIVYHIGVDSLDKWQEDREDKLFYSIGLKCLKENTETPVDESSRGYLDSSHITLTFNLEYLQEKGLITDDFKVRFNDTKDFLTLKGELYQVKSVSYDGPLSEKDILVVVKAEKMERSNMVKNSVEIQNGNEVEW